MCVGDINFKYFLQTIAYGSLNLFGISLSIKILNDKIEYNAGEKDFEFVQNTINWFFIIIYSWFGLILAITFYRFGS